MVYLARKSKCWAELSCDKQAATTTAECDSLRHLSIKPSCPKHTGLNFLLIKSRLCITADKVEVFQFNLELCFELQLKELPHWVRQSDMVVAACFGPAQIKTVQTQSFTRARRTTRDQSMTLFCVQTHTYMHCNQTCANTFSLHLFHSSFAPSCSSRESLNFSKEKSCQVMSLNCTQRAPCLPARPVCDLKRTRMSDKR